jgi:ubiquinone/menaquinone biosynthesis C-methylase UbiE
MTNRVSQAYFDNPEVWNPEAWKQRQGDQVRARLAAEWLPAEVNSVLDVGCGNGVFTNLIEPNRCKVGLDLSRIALGHINTPALQADASILPFVDSSFNASLCMEMLEHLPLPVYQSALNELVRVSRKYILITVPYNEKLRYGSVVCPVCLYEFHPYHHVRQYWMDDFKSLFGIHWHLVRLEGVVPTKRESLPGLWNVIREFQHRKGRNFPRMAICPRCGYTSVGSTAADKHTQRAQSHRSTLKHLWPMQTTFTWWMALYRKEA